MKVYPKLILFLGVIGTSLSGVFIRYSTVPSLVITTMRMIWIVPFLFFYTFLRDREELKHITPRDVLFCGCAGAFLALHFICWCESLKYTSLASSTILVSTEVIFVALGFVFFLKGKIPKLAVISMIIAFGGTALIALADHGGSVNALYGDFFALMAAILIAAYTLIGRIQRSHISNMVYTFLVYLFCLLTLLIICLFTKTSLAGYDLKNWFLGFCLAFFCTFLGHSLFSYALKYLTPSYISTVKLSTGAIAMLLGLILFSEVPGIVQLVGMVIVTVGVLIYTRVERTDRVQL